MKSVVGVLVVIALIVTLLVLLTGVLGMLRGSDFNKKYSNIIMRARVGSQATTILLMLLYFFLD
ncbi:MAG: twin transmembrane helix small protein [Alphaproteobacteria bacterium]|jgi:hypothetical protein|nr:twin transmembrane helix small protein [Alphaproteobacteria bacterium]MBT4711102.1 twin transmembrane helix small protein [Alphaproteobacteria bacterium]